MKLGTSNLVPLFLILFSVGFLAAQTPVAGGCCKTAQCCVYKEADENIYVCYFRYSNCFVYGHNADSCELHSGEANCVVSCENGKKTIACIARSQDSIGSGNIDGYPDPHGSYIPWVN